MKLPDFLMALPALDIPFPDDVVESRAVRSEDALLVFFIFHKDAELPPHSHGAHWGSVLQGEVQLTIDGVTTTYRQGDSYDLPAGVVHAVKVAAGTIALDTFEEPDRYALRR